MITRNQIANLKSGAPEAPVHYFFPLISSKLRHGSILTRYIVYIILSDDPIDVVWDLVEGRYNQTNIDQNTKTRRRFDVL